MESLLNKVKIPELQRSWIRRYIIKTNQPNCTTQMKNLFVRSGENSQSFI